MKTYSYGGLKIQDAWWRSMQKLEQAEGRGDSFQLTNLMGSDQHFEEEVDFPFMENVRVAS